MENLGKLLLAITGLTPVKLRLVLRFAAFLAKSKGG